MTEITTTTIIEQTRLEVKIDALASELRHKNHSTDQAISLIREENKAAAKEYDRRFVLLERKADGIIARLADIEENVSMDKIGERVELAVKNALSSAELAEDAKKYRQWRDTLMNPKALFGVVGVLVATRADLVVKLLASYS